MQRSDTLYVLDEPTTGLHPADVEKLMTQLDGLVESGNHRRGTRHACRRQERLGHGYRTRTGDEGGRVVTFGTPADIAASSISRTAPYPSRFRAGSGADVTAPDRRPRPWQSSPQ
jgi:excinuclease ABC subunit A